MLLLWVGVHKVRKRSCGTLNVLSDTVNPFWVPSVVTLIKGNDGQLHPETFLLSLAHTQNTSKNHPDPVPYLLLFPHQFLEEVPDPLVVAPLLDAGQKSVVELPVDLVELRHFEEDGFYLGDGEDGL